MRHLLASTAALLVLVSCSGGGSSTTPHAIASAPASTPVATATATATSTPGVKTQAIAGTLSLTFPPRTSAAHRRGRAFLSPSAASVTISVTGEPVVTADISASSTQCTSPTPAPAPSSFASPAPTTRTCTITVLAPVGTDTFTATLYDGASATGTILGTGSATQTVIAATPFMVQIAVMGTIGSIVVNVNPPSFTSGTPGMATVTVSAYDADGNLISGTYGSPVTLHDSDSSGTFTLSATTLANSTASATLTYSGNSAQPAPGAGSPVTSATISASSDGVPQQNSTSATVTAQTPPNIYVAENETGSVTVTAENASGNAAPVRTIAGSNTGLAQASGIVVDGAGVTYATGLLDADTEGQQSAIEVFAAGAKGNARPVRSIAGYDTQLNQPVSLALDTAGNLYASNPGGPYVTVYAPGANGDAEPLHVIVNEGLSDPLGIALDSSNRLYVVNQENYGNDASEVYVFPAGADGNVDASAIITGPDTGLNGSMAVALDATGNIYVSNLIANSITAYSPGANGDAIPTRTITGAATALSEPLGLAFDSAGNLYVGNSGTSSILVFAPGANGNVAPIRTISGNATGISSPFQLTIGP